MINSPFFKRKNFRTTVLFAFLTIFFAQNAFSSVKIQAPEKTSEAAKSKDFNTVELVMDHISDHHHWHLWGHHYVYLPVILYTDKGFEVFSSKNFGLGSEEEEQQVYVGNHPYKLIHEKVKVVDSDGKPDSSYKGILLDLSITKNVASLLLSFVLLIAIFIPIGIACRKREGQAPKGMQNVIEPLVIFIRDEVARPNLGANANKFMPFLLTLFFFVWLNNLLGLVPVFPGGANLTGNISLTFTLAIITFLLTNFNGKKKYWKHIFLPHVPYWLYIIMVPVEVIGIFTKPAALMIRLFANITAGHIIVLSLISLIFIFKNAWVATAAVPFTIFISLIELLVGFIQAFIFTVLAALYIGTAMDNHEEH